MEKRFGSKNYSFCVRMFKKAISMIQFYKNHYSYGFTFNKMWTLYELIPHVIPTYTRNINAKVLGRLTMCPMEQVKKYYDDLKKDVAFNAHILNVYKTVGRLDFGQLACLAELYASIRILNPEVVVETGVASGMSSAFILKALNDNMSGARLYSIDLPPKVDYGDFEYVRLPEGKEIGWAIPYPYRACWNPILGKSSDVLPILLRRLRVIDVFLHDSEHSYSNMMMEYKLVWPYLKEGGLLMADDVDRNSAFYVFSLKVDHKPYYLIGPRILPTWNYQNPQNISRIGLLRKDSLKCK